MEELVRPLPNATPLEGDIPAAIMFLAMLRLLKLLSGSLCRTEAAMRLGLSSRSLTILFPMRILIEPSRVLADLEAGLLATALRACVVAAAGLKV